MRDNLLRDRLIDQIVKTRATNSLQHIRDLTVARTHITIYELRIRNPRHPNIEDRSKRTSAGKAGNHGQRTCSTKSTSNQTLHLCDKSKTRVTVPTSYFPFKIIVDPKRRNCMTNHQACFLIIKHANNYFSHNIQSDLEMNQTNRSKAKNHQNRYDSKNRNGPN